MDLAPLPPFEELKSAFARDGYVVLRNALPKALLESLRLRLLDEFDAQKRSGALFEGGGIISGHLNCFPGEVTRPVYDELGRRGIIELVKKLHPKSEHFPNAGCNFNLPGSVHQHYHPDGVYIKDFSILNVALVDTDLRNGAIDVLPGTQQRFYRFWEYAVGREYKKTTRLPLAQGDVLIRVSTLWHRGMPNHTELARPMLAFTWEDGGKDVDPFSPHEGKIRFLPNWYRSDLVSRVRERTFVAAPITYSAVRFAMSLVSNRGYSTW